MAIKTCDELLAGLRSIIPEGSTSDAEISLIEDITDTINDYENKTRDTTNWHDKYIENDNAWRQKYRDRFYNSGSDEDIDEMLTPEEPEKKPLKFEDLFKEG